jgi:hypothetical protein
MKFLDLFSGGSQSNGTPTTAGAGDGGKASVINDILSRATGVYAAVTGSGTKSGPAPNPGQPGTVKTNWALYAGIAAAAGLVLWLVTRK